MLMEIAQNKLAVAGTPPADAKCALCLGPGPLRLSHIIPEFCFARLYDEKHRLREFSPAAPDLISLPQKGFRRALLCDKCEALLNTEYEHPFKKYWLDGKQLEKLNGQDVLRLHDVDYRRFKLFHLSVLWRASAYGEEMFSNVKLGAFHSEKIRQMLLAGEAGRDWQYPIISAALMHQGKLTDNYITSPEKFRLYGHNGYMFTFAGCQWAYIVSSHRSSELEFLALKEDELPVGTRELREVLQGIDQRWGKRA